MESHRRNAIVTGAAGGLGRAMAVRLATDGWCIAIADVDSAGSAETLRLVEAAGGTGRVEQLDVSQLEAWEALGDRLRGEWSSLDLLVNNAGVAGYGDVGVFPLADWQWLLEINLLGTIYGCHTLVDWLKASAPGTHIINTASFAALAPSPGMAAYNVSKAGIVALSETLYTELQPHGVGVTAVCPMFFRTGIHAAARSHDALRGAMNEAGTERSKLTSEGVAETAIRAMQRGQLYAIPGGQARWFWWLRRLSPVGFLDGIAREVAKWRRANSVQDDARQPASQ